MAGGEPNLRYEFMLCHAGTMDVLVSRRLIIPAAELAWRFSRSSGPGGQHVNTSDSRVELSWNIAYSPVLTPVQRERLLTKLASRLVGGVLTVSAAEQRSQLQNRRAAINKLVQVVAQALAPDSPQRRATKPTKGSQRRRLESKSRRSQVKQNRQRPSY